MGNLNEIDLRQVDMEDVARRLGLPNPEDVLEIEWDVDEENKEVVHVKATYNQQPKENRNIEL